MKFTKRNANTMTYLVHERTGVPIKTLLNISAKAERELSAIDTLRGSCSVDPGSPAIRELIDAGLLSVEETRGDGLAHGTLTTDKRS